MDHHIASKFCMLKDCIYIILMQNFKKKMVNLLISVLINIFDGGSRGADSWAMDHYIALKFWMLKEWIYIRRNVKYINKM
jgi:hypothetical protein